MFHLPFRLRVEFCTSAHVFAVPLQLGRSLCGRLDLRVALSLQCRRFSLLAFVALRELQRQLATEHEENASKENRD